MSKSCAGSNRCVEARLISRITVKHTQVWSIFIRVLLCFALLLATFSDIQANNFKSLQEAAAQATHLNLKINELQALVERKVVTGKLETSQGKEIAGYGVVLVDAAPQEFIELFRSLSFIKQTPNVVACQRFSPIPVLDDLTKLTIRNKDLLGLMRAKVNEADIKLSSADIGRFQRLVGPQPRFTTKIGALLTTEYKQILLDKAQRYMAQGSSALGDYADQTQSVSASEALIRMRKYQTEQAKHAEKLYQLLDEYPRQSTGESESFLYWVSQKFGGLKPVISLIHVLIYRTGERVFIASQQVYSSHYTEAGLNVVELIPLTDPQGHQATLVMCSVRLQVDLFDGAAGFMRKRMAQPHLLDTLKDSLLGLRGNIEASHIALR
jgi:hypothetical protein